MAWVEVLAAAAVTVGVGGYVLELRRTRHNDERERGLLLWMTLAWAGVAAFVGTRTA